MTYTIDRTIVGTPFAIVVERTKDALGKHGFGVLTEIDVRHTMRKKLDADIGDYLILGACNPSMALEAIKVEPKVGAMLPCNVIVRSLAGGNVMVSAVDPVASMQAIENTKLKAVAATVRDLLVQTVKSV